MSIIRRAPRPRQFHVADIAIIDDRRLSWEALGLHLYLCSRPDNWSVHVSHLASLSRGARRDKIYRILSELRCAGYAGEKILRDQAGRIESREWLIYDSPQGGHALDPEKPVRAKPDKAKPPLPNTDLKTKDSSSSTDAEKKAEQDFVEMMMLAERIADRLAAGEKIERPAAYIGSSLGRRVKQAEADQIMAKASDMTRCRLAEERVIKDAASARLDRAYSRSRESGTKLLAREARP